METSPEKFDSLQKLLRLKRHEQPPPRYFNEFSGKILARIEKGEGVEVKRWWHRWGFDLRPALMGAGAVAACAAIFFSIGTGDEGTAGGTMPDAFAGAAALDPNASTNPVNAVQGQPFDNIFKIKPAAAGFEGK